MTARLVYRHVNGHIKTQDLLRSCPCPFRHDTRFLVRVCSFTSHMPALHLFVHSTTTTTITTTTNVFTQQFYCSSTERKILTVHRVNMAAVTRDFEVRDLRSNG